MSNQPKESVFFCESEFGARTRKPMVKVSYDGPLPVRMSPETAMELAANLMAAAHASITDAFLIEFLEKRVGADPASVIGIIAEFRQWREQREP